MMTASHAVHSPDVFKIVKNKEENPKIVVASVYAEEEIYKRRTLRKKK